MIDECRPTCPEARRVLEILERGSYARADGTEVSIATPQRESERGTRLFTPSALESLRRSDPRRDGGAGRVEVVDATTQEAARELARHCDVVLLNFASARNPGGGFLGGARAQEEDLCRCSGLYRTLLTQPEYYRINRRQRSLLYTDHLIYSPRVPFLRVSAASDFEQPFFPSVITAPAPNAGAMREGGAERVPEIAATFERRWANVLGVAEDTGHRAVLLGAWGCGAFRNDPALVAETARRAIHSPRFAGVFDRIVFAIPDVGRRGAENLRVFQGVLGGGDQRMSGNDGRSELRGDGPN